MKVYEIVVMKNGNVLRRLGFLYKSSAYAEVLAKQLQAYETGQVRYLVRGLPVLEVH